MSATITGNAHRDTDDAKLMRRWVIVLSTLAVAAQLYLVWGFDFFPTIDGPAHTHMAYAMYESLRGDAFYGGLVELNSKLNPNLVTQWLLVALMAIATPLVAEKLLLTLYFIAFAAAAGYALHGINKKALCLLPLFLFCSFTFTLSFGFYNFTFSTVIFLGWFGYWWQHRDSLTLRTSLCHALWASLAFCTHVFAFVASVLAIGITGLAAIAQQARAGRLQWQRAVWTHALPPLLGSLPALLACLYFLFHRFGAETTADASNFSLATVVPRLQQFLTASSFAPYDNIEFLAAGLFAPLIVAPVLLLMVKRRRNVSAWLPFAICFAIFFLIYLTMPFQWIVRWMPPRFQPLVFITLLLWLASLLPATLKPAHCKAIGFAGLAFTLLSLAARMTIFTEINAYYRELASLAPDIRSNSSLVVLRLQPFPTQIDAFIQSGSRIASMRHAIDLKNFQGQSDDHPFQFKPSVGASAALGGDAAIISLSPDIHLMNYERTTGHAIDYVILYGFRQFAINPAGLANLDAQLDKNYRRIRVSSPTGFASLYARNSSALTTPALDSHAANQQ